MYPTHWSSRRTQLSSTDSGRAVFPPSTRKDHMRTLIGAMAVALLAGCASADADKPATPTSQTNECMTYRSMMTAPMTPDAHERLRLACERSRVGVVAAPK